LGYFQVPLVAEATFSLGGEVSELGENFNSKSRSPRGGVYCRARGRSGGDNRPPSGAKCIGSRGTFADDAGSTKTILGDLVPVTLSLDRCGRPVAAVATLLPAENIQTQRGKWQ